MMKLYFKIVAVLFLLVYLGGCGSNDPKENGETDPPAESSFLRVSPEKFEVVASSKELYATVTTNQDNVSILSSKSWCKAALLPEAKEDNNLKITIDENTGTDARTATILLSAKNTPNTEIIIIQKGKSTDPGGDEGETLEFRVASYNVRFASAEDAAQGDGWDVRKGALTDIIKNHGFDIVGTQEANASQWADMKTLLPDYSSVGHPYGGASGTGHNCITFYKTHLFEVLDGGTFWYSETPDTPSIGWDATDRRICYWTKFKEKVTGKEFYFFNSHFYWQFTTAKENSGPLLARKIKEIAGSNYPVIATGDFNSLSSTSQIQAILEVLADAYDMSESARQGPVGTNLGGGNFTGTGGTSRIDYIFVSQTGIRVLDYKVINDVYEPLGHYPSDHFPVTSKISIKLD